MKRPCISCSRDVLLTFLEAVTGIQQSRTLLLGPRQYTRTLSSATPRRSSILEPDTIGHGLDKDEGSILASSPGQLREIKIRNTASSLKRSTIDTKSWKSQRELHFGGLCGLVEELELRTITEVNPHNTTTTILQDSQNRSTISSLASEKRHLRPKPGTRKTNGSPMEQDAGSDNLSHTVVLEQSPTTRKKDRWRNRALHTQNTDETQPSVSGTGDEVSTELSTQNQTPRKKDRWRNRVAVSGSSEGVHLGKGTSIRNSIGSSRVQARRFQPSQDGASVSGDEKPLPDANRLRARSRTSNEDLPAWKVHKMAVKTKLDGNDWRPLKRLSPDAREGVRQLHSEDPVLWSTAHLADHFQISPDAIRRILKSNWKPTEKERDEQQERWIRRGETIWDRYVELGRKAPRKWRGLNPMPAAKLQSASNKAEFKPEEWSQDSAEDTGEGSGLVPDLASRIS